MRDSKHAFPNENVPSSCILDASKQWLFTYWASFSSFFTHGLTPRMDLEWNAGKVGPNAHVTNCEIFLGSSLRKGNLQPYNTWESSVFPKSKEGGTSGGMIFLLWMPLGTFLGKKLRGKKKRQLGHCMDTETESCNVLCYILLWIGVSLGLDKGRRSVEGRQ